MAAAMFALAGVVSSTTDGVVTGAKSNACVAFSKQKRPDTREVTLSIHIYRLLVDPTVVLWLVAFTQSWTGIPWTVSAEIPADDLRDKTLAVGAASGYWAGMVVGLVSPYLQLKPVNMGGKIGFIWGGVSILTVVWVFFFVPELKVSLDAAERIRSIVHKLILLNRNAGSSSGANRLHVQRKRPRS